MPVTSRYVLAVLALSLVACSPARAAWWDTLLPGGQNLQDLLQDDPNLVERFTIPAIIRFPGAACDSVISDAAQELAFKGVFKTVVAPILGLEPKNLRLERVRCDADSIETSFEILADNALTNANLTTALNRLLDTTALVDKLPQVLKDQYRITRAVVFKLWDEARLPALIAVPDTFPFNTTYWREAVPRSVVNAVTDNIRVRVPLSLALPGTDCKNIVRDGVEEVTQESEYQLYVATVQELAAAGLGVPRDRVFVSQVECNATDGSLVTNFELLADAFTPNAQIQAAIDGLVADPAKTFPAPFTNSLQATSVRATAAPADQQPGWSIPALPTQETTPFGGRFRARLPGQITFDVLEGGCLAALGSAQAEASFRAGFQSLMAAAGVVPAERVAITRVRCETTTGGATPASVVADFELIVPEAISDTENSRQVFNTMTNILPETPFPRLYREAYSVQSVRNTSPAAGAQPPPPPPNAATGLAFPTLTLVMAAAGALLLGAAL